MPGEIPLRIAMCSADFLRQSEHRMAEWKGGICPKKFDLHHTLFKSAIPDCFVDDFTTEEVHSMQFDL